MFAALMVVVAVILLAMGIVKDFYRDYTLKEKRKKLDTDFYEANNHLKKFFPTDAKRMREAYEFQKTDHHLVD